MSVSCGHDYSLWSPASSSSSSSSSPIHPASLVDTQLHSSALLQLIDAPVSHAFLDYIAEYVAEVVDFALGCDDPKHAEPTRGRSGRCTTRLADFIALTIKRAEARASTLLVALVYIARSRTHLAISYRHGAAERLFLGALMTASKYTQDNTLQNVHWALISGVFGTADVGLIEREFLAVLDWELGVSEEEVVVHWEGIIGGGGVAIPDINEEKDHSLPSAEPEPSSPVSNFAAGSKLPTPAHPTSRPAPAIDHKHIVTCVLSWPFV
ncbi:unnamed protein product [Mycena citricolor]|uniref:Cyclin N-terminal domain-containing protein n=1 Tax=Mycena citricolor TaxID=2018698 RepID=A0AAD2Q5N3_9AGAR|nr:unnamed protein product [Mycena citricolor]CAK5278956.1 unnamed protein product [Mycena citricolor]